MKFILSILLCCCVQSYISAQEIYATKAGRVSFFSAAPLENIRAVNNQVDSKLATNGQMTFMLAIKGFRFENATMQEHFNENYMESTKYPKAIFFGSIANINDVKFGTDGTYATTVTGDMEIHGIKKRITATGSIDIKGGKAVIKSKFKILLADYNIKGAWIGEKIAREIEVTVDCKYE